MKNFPLITIGMTCFNAEDTIAQAIESALMQDYANKEIVIVDDGSSDGSRTLLEKFAAEHTIINYIPHEQNKGFAGALNTIIKNAKGEFIAIFDDDDISQLQRLSKQYERIIQYEKEIGAMEVLCHAARMQTFENGTQRYEKTVGTNIGIAPHGKDMVRRILYGNLGDHGKNIVGSCANCARMGRVRVFRGLNGFDENMRRGEDTDFSIRFALNGGHFVGIEEPLIHQAMTTGAEKTLDKEYNVEKFFTEKHKEFLQKEGWYKFAIEWLDVRYANLHNRKIKFLFLLGLMFFKYPIKTVKKLIWSMPAKDTRSSFKKWHLGKLNNKHKITHSCTEGCHE